MNILHNLGKGLIAGSLIGTIASVNLLLGIAAFVGLGCLYAAELMALAYQKKLLDQQAAELEKLLQSAEAKNLDN